MTMMTMHEAVTKLVDAEVALARHLDELGVTGITDNPGSRTSHGTDLFEAVCMVVCIDAESSGQTELLAALGCDQVCGEGWSWDSPLPHGQGLLPFCECSVCMAERQGATAVDVLTTAIGRINTTIEPLRSMPVHMELSNGPVLYEMSEQNQSGIRSAINRLDEAEEILCAVRDTLSDEEDDDPVCVCGVYLSEHSMMGCPEGFQTPAQWERERSEIRRKAQAYDDDEPDIDDDFPMSVEYDGLWGASDWAIEEAAQRETEYEAGLGY